MTKINYCLLEEDRKQRGKNSYWTVPMNQQKFKPFMRCKLVSANLVGGFTGADGTTVIIRSINRAINTISSDYSNKTIVGIIQMVNYTTPATSTTPELRDINGMIVHNNIEFIIPSNPQEFEFVLSFADGTILQYSYSDSINMVLSCEYIDSDESKNDYLNLTKSSLAVPPRD